MEMRIVDGQGKGTVMKHLMVTHEGKTPEIKRMIVQAPGSPPMEMPVGMMSGMMSSMAQRGGQAKKAEAPGMGEKVGSETLTVPAGTFECEHYRSHSGNDTADLWISSKVSPYGLIKMTSAASSMVLQKVLEHETSQIKGEPQKIEMPHF